MSSEVFQRLGEGCMLSEAGLVLTRDMGGPKVTPYIDLACQRDEKHRAH